jgi:hypothetical protein
MEVFEKNYQMIVLFATVEIIEVAYYQINIINQRKIMDQNFAMLVYKINILIKNFSMNLC